MWRINKVNRSGVALLVLLFIALPFLNVHSAIDPDLNPRLIAISAFCAICFVFISPKPVRIPETYRNIGLASIGILFISLLAILSSINPGDALAEWLRIFIIYAFALVSLILLRKSKPELVVILRFISMSILIFSAFAIYQTIPVVEQILNHKRVSISSDLASTLSNKNFFSEVLVLLLPATFYALLFDEKHFKFLHLIALFLAAFYILILASMACWIAVSVSLMIVGLVSFFNRRATAKTFKKSHLATFAIAMTLLISIGIVILNKGPIGRSVKFKADMISKYILDPTLLDQNVASNNNSVFDRILMTRNSLKMIADHPILGAGLNNWKLLYASYGIGGTEVINSGAMNFEHPHNDYLLIFSEQGIFGILFYIAFFFFVFKVWIKKWNKINTTYRSFLLVILFSLMAFLVMSFFSYPRSRIYTPILLMFFISMIFIDDDADEKSILLKPVFSTLIGVVCLFACFVFCIRLNSEVHAKNLMSAKAKGNFARVIRESERIDPFFYPIEIYSTSIEWYRGMALFYSGQIPAALIEYKKGILKTPYNIRTLNDIATAFEQTGQPDSAIAYYKKALAISPHLTDSKLNLSATYFNQNKVDSAYRVLNTLYYPDLNIGPRESYVQFMKVILTAKISDSLKTSGDTVLTNKMNTFMNDIPRTKKYIRAYRGKSIWPDVFTDADSVLQKN